MAQFQSLPAPDEMGGWRSPIAGEEWVRVPLEDGLQRFARFAPIFAPRKCNPYTPQGYR